MATLVTLEYPHVDPIVRQEMRLHDASRILAPQMHSVLKDELPAGS